MTSKPDAPTELLKGRTSLKVESGSSSRRRPSPSPARSITDTTSSPHKHKAQANAEDSTSDHDSDSSHDGEDSTPNLTRRDTLSKSYTQAEEHNVLRKLDRRLTLLLSLLYMFSFLDRSNIGNARVAGMQTSLNITDTQFDLTLTAFYITYITFEWMILLYRLVPPHIYIASCVFTWGLVACLQAVVTNFAQLLTLRGLLGITEAAFGPGVPFYMTFFYRREELAYRVGLQISAAPLATSFASSLAWVIVKLSAGSPLESWRALFLFEGFPSLVAAVFAFYLIPDSPAKTRWLSPRERRIAVLRLRRETTSSAAALQSENTSKLNTVDLISTLTDPKAWLNSLMFLSVNVSFASLPVFLPTVIHDMSFSAVTSQILAAPPYLVAFVFVLLISRASDRVSDSRGLFLAASAAVSCLSYLTIALTGLSAQRGLISAGNTVWVRYAAVYGAAMGLFASVVLVITWQLNNQASATGKGVGMVILNVVGQTGPLIGVRLFPEGDEPYFVVGMAVCAAFMAGVVVLALGLRAYLRWLNGRIEMDDKGKGIYEMMALRDDEPGEGEGLVRGKSKGGGDEGFRYML